MKLTIEHDIIKALLKVAAKQDVRYYLRGMLIDVRQNDITLVATNGHALLAVPLPADALEGERTIGQWIVPREVLESVKPCKVGRTALPLAIDIIPGAVTPDPDRPGVTIKGLDSIIITGATTATAKPIDGQYPHWRRVMPAGASLEVAQFDPEYVSVFGDVHKLLTGNSKFNPVIHHNGNGGALVSGLGRDALGVLMPLRVDAVEMAHPGLPAWCVQ